MREKSVEVPEPEQKEAFGRTEPQSSDQAATNGRRRQSLNPNTTLSRHASKCRICNHPDRAAIEFDFLNWRNPFDLVQSYHFRGLSTIYRHAHATGLFAKRRLNLRFALERIVERVGEVPVTATSVIRAARAVARINDAGEWVDPPSRLIITHLNSEDSSSCGDQAPVGPDSHPAAATATQSREGLVSRGGTCPELPCDGRRSRRNRDMKARLGGRGFSPDIKPRSSRSSSRAAKRGLPGRRLVEPGGLVTPEGTVPGIPGRDASITTARPSLVFDDSLLDEPSDTASAELPRINGKPAEPEVILTITPEFARCREERRRAIEADLAARAAANAVTEGQPAPFQIEPRKGMAELVPSLPAGAGEVGGAVPTRATDELTREQNVAPSSSSLPQAAVPNSAPSALNDSTRQTQTVPPQPSSLPEAAVPSSASLALPHPAGFGNNIADNQENVASSSTLLPQAASNTPATACPESGRGATQAPPAFRRGGSSGCVDPPFPFTPEPLRRWKPRRRF